MRNRIFAVLAIAILAGGGLAYGTYNFMQAQPAKSVSVPTQPVVVAAADLQLGSELKKEDLKVINVLWECSTEHIPVSFSTCSVPARSGGKRSSWPWLTAFSRTPRSFSSVPTAKRQRPSSGRVSRTRSLRP